MFRLYEYERANTHVLNVLFLSRSHVAINAIKSAGPKLRIQLARLPSADEDTEAVLQVHLSCGGKKLGMQICGGIDRPYNGDTAIYIDQVCVCVCV